MHRLCNLRVSAIQTEFDLRDVKTQRGDFVQKDLAIKCNTPVRNDIVVRSYMTYCSKRPSLLFFSYGLSFSLTKCLIPDLIEDRKSTVVFAVDIAHAEELTNVFRRHGFDARVLSSRTNDAERAQLLADFRARKFPVIVNCGILTEGTGECANATSLVPLRSGPRCIDKRLGVDMFIFDSCRYPCD